MYYHPVRFNGTHDGDAVAVSNELHEQLFNVTADSAQPHVAATHKILVPVDGSEGALRATAYVIGSVFRRAASEIHLLNVQPPLMTGDIGPLVTVEMVMRERLVAGHEALHRARALLDASGTPCTMAVRFGKPAETIVRYVKDRGIDAIVMGTRGMGALKNLLLGSVATKVVGSADVPVTLVKGGPRSRRLARGGPPKAERPVPTPAGVRGGDALGRSRSGLRAA